MADLSTAAQKPALMVGQSGGATAVINASLAGVIRAAKDSGQFGRILGAKHGIEGLLNGAWHELQDLPDDELGRLRNTPSAALGTGRYKLQEGDIDRALGIMRQERITAFVYIGGNDSADTAHQLAERAQELGQELVVASVPKTIDNDLPETDHCPGYGSMARYMGNAVRDATYDLMASPQLYAVKFVEVMGRYAGWVAASGALGFSEAERDLEPIILLPERAPNDAAEVLAAIERDLKQRRWSVVVVPETLESEGGEHFGGSEPEYRDAFGHPYYASTAEALTRLVNQELDVRARYDKPGTAARMSISLASEVDLEEAEMLGAAAVERLVQGETGFITMLRRVSNDPYRCELVAVPVGLIANKERPMEPELIAENGMGITDAFREYAMPLLGPEPFPVYTRLNG